jgi:hypothetical protein
VPSGLRSRLMDRFGAWLAAIATEALGRHGLHGPLLRLHGESGAGKCVKGAKARAALSKPLPVVQYWTAPEGRSLKERSLYKMEGESPTVL